MANTRSGITGIALKIAGPAVMAAVLLADHWLPASQANTANLLLILLGLVAFIAGTAGVTSAVVSGGILLAVDFYWLRHAAGPDALSAGSSIHLLSLLLATILAILPFGFRRSAASTAGEASTSREEKRSASNPRRVDVVTGLLTRHYLMSMVQIDWERWRRYATPFSLLLVEVEGLDALRRSDPSESDALLRVLANRMTSSLRGLDVASRIHDNRFLVLLPQTNEAGAVVVGKKLLKALNPVQMNESGGHQINGLRIAAAAVHRSDDRLQNVMERIESAIRMAHQPGFEGIATVEPENANSCISSN